MTDRRPRRGNRALAIVVALMVAVSGCATVPTGGAVLSGRAPDRDDALDDAYVRLIPDPPRKGWSPGQIVSGFLVASASFENDHGVARQYLAPEARRQWQPGIRATVYDGPVTSLPEQEGANPDEQLVSWRARERATIEQDGQYVSAPSGSEIDVEFRLRKVDGEWRITSLPDGLMLSRRDVSRAYRALNLYFFEPEQRTLVPNPVYMPLGPRQELATRLVRALLRGPTGWLDPAVRSAFPEGTKLVEGASISDKVVTLQLSEHAAEADSDRMARMSAQLMWTVRQLPDVRQLRLEIDGEPVRIPGGSDEGTLQSASNWSANDPDGLSGTPASYVERDGRLVKVRGGERSRVPGPAGEGAVPVEEPAVSLDEQRVATLGDSRRTAYVTGLGRDGRVRQELTVSDDDMTFASLSWDRYGNLWVVESGEGGSRVWVVEEGKQPIRVESSYLDDHEVETLRVARDGVRIAVVVAEGGGDDARIQLGRAVRSAERVQVDNFLPVAPDVESVQDLGWYSAANLVVLGRVDRGPITPFRVPVDGADASPITSVGEMSSIAAAPGAPLMLGITSPDGPMVCYSRDGLAGWQCDIDGSSPAYPG